MTMKLTKAGIELVPDNEQDEAYIADTLGLKTKDDTVLCRRVPVIGIDSAIAYLFIGRD